MVSIFRVRASVVIALMVVGAMSAATLSDPAVAEAQKKRQPAKAKRVFKKGKKLFKAGRYAEAAVQFNKAYQYDPRPGIMYNAARAYEESGRLIKALQYYRTAIGLKPSDAMEKELVIKIKDVEIYLRAQGVDVLNLDDSNWTPQATVTIKSDPPGGTVIINGHKVGETPLTKYEVPQGVVTVEVTRLGYKPAVRELTAVAGKTYTVSPKLYTDDVAETEVDVGMLEIVSSQRGLTVFVDDVPDYTTPTGIVELPVGEHKILVEGDGVEPFETTVTITKGELARLDTAPKVIVIEQEEVRLLTNQQWGGVTLIGGGVLFAVGSVVGVLALSDAATYTNDRSEPGRAGYRDDAQSEALIADIFLGTGAVMAGVGGLIYLLSGEDAPEEGAYDELAGSKLDVSPLLFGGGGGAAVEYTW